MRNRLSPPVWEHDSYPLRLLAARLRTTIAKYFGSVRDGVVVDLGCGDSPYRPLFDRYAFRYIPCDLAGGKGEVILEPGRTIEIPSRSVQAVVSFQVLEHVWDVDWYLTEARRILRTEGHLLLSTHGTWFYHPHPDDFRRWTRSGLIREIESRGFLVLDVHAIVGPLAWSSLFRCMALSVLLRGVPFIGPAIASLTTMLWNLWLRAADAITPQKWIDDNAAIYLVVARPTRAQ